MESGISEKKELTRSAILSNNIRKYLELNQMSQKTAARLAGLRTTTLNSWIQEISYPREKNLQRLADVFHVNITDLTGDVEATDERRKYLTIGASNVLSCFNSDKDFQQWCELGLRLRSRKRLRTYLRLIEEGEKPEDQFP